MTTKIWNVSLGGYNYVCIATDINDATAKALTWANNLNATSTPLTTTDIYKAENITQTSE